MDIHKKIYFTMEIIAESDDRRIREREFEWVESGVTKTRYGSYRWIFELSHYQNRTSTALAEIWAGRTRIAIYLKPAWAEYIKILQKITDSSL